MVAQRLGRNTAIVCLVLTAVAGAWFRDVRVAGGVLAGGVLVGLSLWALTGLAGAVVSGAETAAEEGASPTGTHRETRPISRSSALVKIFTRHAILAIVAYVMMVRLHLDPVGMVVGVTSVVVAASIEAARPR